MRPAPTSSPQAVPLARCLGVLGSVLFAAGCDGEIAGGDFAEPPLTGDCHADLSARGVEFTPGPAAMGVEDPVTVTYPIRGIAYRYGASASLRETAMMDCRLALALWQAGSVFAAHRVVEVSDLGIYNYRCIGGGTPPGCTLSMHAYALAIDLAAFVTADGLRASVEEDFVVDSDATCTSDTEGEKDALLHAIVCELYQRGIFRILLTPNYNDAHRDHFHVDLTPDGDFLRLGRTAFDMGPDRH